jgi:hypothetical protein
MRRFIAADSFGGADAKDLARPFRLATHRGQRRGVSVHGPSPEAVFTAA